MARKSDNFDSYDDETENTRDLGGDEYPNPDTTTPAVVPKPTTATAAAPPAQGWDAARVSKYFADKGVTPNASSPDYWAGKWNEWGQYDPTYFETRLSQADEFTGNTQGEGPKTTIGSDTPTRGGGSPNDVGVGAPGQNTSPQDDALSKLLADLMAKNGETAAKRNALMGRLTDLMDQYSKPVTADDPNIAPLANAYKGNVDRSTKRYREQAAERAHSEGVGTGSFDSAIGGSILQGGRDSANYESQLMHDEMLSRRSALSDTLQQGGSLLSAQDQSDIQSRMAAIDAQLKSRGLDINEEQGDRSLDINTQKMLNDFILGKGQLDLGGKSLDLQKLLGLSSLDLQRYLGSRGLDLQGKSLDQQNKQWYDQFAYNAGKDTSSLDALLQQYLLSK